MNKSGSILEVIWFVMGGLLLFIGADITREQGFEQGWKYFAIALLALFMYFRRRQMRINKK